MSQGEREGGVFHAPIKTTATTLSRWLSDSELRKKKNEQACTHNMERGSNKTNFLSTTKVETIKKHTSC